MLRREPGGRKILPLLSELVISAVNLSEVLERQAPDMAPVDLAEELTALGIEIVAATQAQAVVAAELKAIKVKGGLSLGDRFCLALGRERGAKVVTADRAWVGLPHGVEVESIR